ncbi:MAG: SEC-C domain-containing protein [Spirochaetales bacterium]|nr:SEC-C domain-containing protein [Spirochaetales bacterium]
MTKPDTAALAYVQGKRALAAHDAVAAIRLLRIAVDGCPASRRAELAHRLYWLSIALRRLGKEGLAIKALASAQRLAPRGSARELYAHVANGYGMPKAACEEHDDYRAFCAIHVRRYLERVPDRRFASQEEIDEVLTVIAGAWLRLNEAEAVGDSPCDDKLKTFEDLSIEFPTLRPRAGSVGKIIAADFVRGRAMQADDRCPCGSGLPYRMCCGRTRMPYERERG